MTEAGELMKQRLAALDILARTKLKDDLGKMDDASVTLMKHGKPHLNNRSPRKYGKFKIRRFLKKQVRRGWCSMPVRCPFN